MQRIGLYYPYIHFRDEEWLKAAALYWPRMARVVPAGYTPADAGVALALKDELDFLVDVDPYEAACAVAPLFTRVQYACWRDHRQAVRQLLASRYAYRLDEREVRSAGDLTMMREDAYGYTLPLRSTPGPPSGPDLVAFHPNELGHLLGPLRGLTTQVVSGADQRGDRCNWHAMDPSLAWIVKCVIVDELTRRTGFVPTTDQTTGHAFSGGWDTDRLAVALLGDEGAEMYRQGARRLDSDDSWPPNLTTAVEPELVSAVGHMAVRCVLPRGLGDIPVEKIIRLRTRHATEFDAFADAVVATAADLRETLSSIQHPTALQEYLRLTVRRRFKTPLQDLESAMRSLRMEVGYTAVGYKLELGTAATASLGGLAAGSALVTAGALAFGVASIRHRVAASRDAELRNSEVAYLLRLQYDLQPQSLVRRILRGSARALGTGV